MATRFSDDLFENTDGSDFIVRKRIPLAVQIFLVFAAAFVAIYFTASLMSEKGSKTLFFITLTLSIGTLTGFTIYFSARLRDLVLATEFQNAMLASAAQLSTRFCLITKRDGTIAYVDPGFQKLFPNFMQTADRNIDGLLSGVGISEELIQRIALMLQQGVNERVLLSLRKDDGGVLPIMMTIDVLPRPKGYFLLRGRDYVEKRSVGGATGPAQSASEWPLAEALNVLPYGILVAGANGTITYANRALEGWLGFNAGEMLARAPKIGQIIYQYAGNDAGRLVSGNFDGDVVLQRKDKSLMNMHIRQATLGKSTGLSAIISPPEAKK